MPVYQIDIATIPQASTAFVRALRQIGRMPLNRAVEIAEGLKRCENPTLIAGIGGELAEEVAGLLIEAGATVAIRESTVTGPMICEPYANELYRWSSLRLLKRV